MTNNVRRSEYEVFADLAALCVRPGYAHALGYLCFRDNTILYADKVTEADMQKLFNPARLSRTEINTLIGLMVKAEIDWDLPAPETLQEYADSSERLLAELHHVLAEAFSFTSTLDALASGEFKPFDRGEAMREPIFYASESAYNFQYLDLAVRKYAADAAWLQAHRGFTIEDAVVVARAVERVCADRIDAHREHMRHLSPDEWTMLPGFSVSVPEVTTKSGLAADVVERILMAFSLPAEDRNASFASLQDFNAVTATPLLRQPNGEFLSLQNYALAEAIYDSPFYWMVHDKAYLPTLEKHRGEFAEGFVAERLGDVFGRDRVFANVDIWKSKGVTAGEIDVLVIWGDRAIVVQAKSKRLTLEARKGNDQIIRDDFKKSVQVAYDQGIECAQCLGDARYRLATPDGCEIALSHEINEIFVFCVVSDHYPALSFQSRQFLKTQTVPRVRAALVTDVFLVDVMTELLSAPLQFLSYIDRRARYGDRLLASQELTILGYHLKQNLWVEPEAGLMSIGEDFSAGVDIAMAARRTGLEGDITPDGILTRFQGTTLGRIVKQIEARPEPATIDLGFLLLEMGEDMVIDTSRMIDKLAIRSGHDGQLHDLTLAFATGEGLTVHCNDAPMPVAAARLRTHCQRRKYKQKADRWFGLCVRAGNAELRFGVSLSDPWVHDDALEEATLAMAEPISVAEARSAVFRGTSGRKKIGRNEPCPCGSGRKYKRCCMA